MAMEESRSFNEDINCKMGEVDRIVAEKLSAARKRIRSGFEGFKDFDPLNEDHRKNIASLVKKELCSAGNSIHTGISGINKDRNHDSSAFKQMMLEFRGKIPEEILTGAEIKGEGGVPLEVVLSNVPTGEIVDVGPGATLGVEIVLLKEESDASEGDDWFQKSIIWETGGNKSLLAGDTFIKLQKGIGVLNTIKFIHRASSMKPPRFCLGVRVDTIGMGWIKEAKTNPFTVKNFRKKYYVKHEIPSLTDCVCRLKNIRKGGEIAKRLQDKGIKTVEDFLIRFLIDPEGLTTIVQLPLKKFAATLTNAQACRDRRMYCYSDSQQKAAIVFNIFGQVLRPPVNIMPPEIQEGGFQESLLASAYKHWEDVEHFDDESSLEEHLAGLTNSWSAAHSQIQNLPFRYDFTPNRENSFDYSNFTTNSVESHNYFITHSRSSSFNLGPLWDFDAATQGFVGLQDVHNRRPLNGWNIFWCIWRWRSAGKKISNQQKVHCSLIK